MTDLDEKNPPGRHGVVTRVREVCRELQDCSSGDELMAFLHTPQMLDLGFTVAHSYVGDWIGPEANCGLAGFIAQMGANLGCERETRAWVRFIEKRVQSCPF